MERMKSSHIAAYPDSIVSIFWEDEPENPDKVGVLKGVKTIPYGDMSLADCYCLAVGNGYRSGDITVVIELPLWGDVYRYGNHGEYWEKVGKTEGYA